MKHNFDPRGSIVAQVRAIGLGDRYLPDRRVVLYRFFDADSALLYVGVTCNPRNRWQWHKTQSSWWAEVAVVAIEHHPNEWTALPYEVRAIKVERPIHNRRSAPSFHADLMQTSCTAPKLPTRNVPLSLSLSRSTRRSRRRDVVPIHLQTVPGRAGQMDGRSAASIAGGRP